MIVATKVGMDMPGLGKGLTRAQIERGAEDSLRRLQIDRIDLYYAHEDDPKTPLDETLAAFDRLVRDGKVRAIGASNYSAERLDAAVAASAAAGGARYECLQPLYNLMDRAGFEDQPRCDLRAPRRSASPRISRSPAASCRASTGAPRTLPDGHAPAASSATSPSAACACSTRCMRRPSGSAAGRRPSPSPG